MISKTILCVIFITISSSIYLIRCQNNFVDENNKLSPNDLNPNVCSVERKSCSGNLSFGEAFNYLQSCGYITQEESVDGIENNAFTDALMSFQEFMAIETNGVLDEKVFEVMRSHVCTQTDLFGKHSKGKRRLKRSNSIGKWLPYTDRVYEIQLNYWVEGDPSKEYGDMIEKAAEVWTKVTNIKLRRLPRFDICRYQNIRFDIQKLPLNGGAHTLSYGPHEFGTPIKVMTNFMMFTVCTKLRNCGEFKNFEYDTYNVTVMTSLEPDNLREGNWGEVAHYLFIHIWGHLLGLEHSVNGSTSVMESTLDNKTFSSLSDDDISSIQLLYGSPLGDTSETITDIHKEMPDLFGNAPDFCDPSTYPKVDSILEMPDKTWIIFREHHYIEVGPNGQTPRSPRRIVWDFKNFTGEAVEASFSWNDTIFLFYGDYYWKYRNNRFITKRKISEGFKGLPDGPFDTAFVWNRNQKTYFFKGGQYWKYDSVLKEVPVNDGYPRKVSDDWKGIPEDFHVAVSSRHRNQTYFFYDMWYYKYDDINRKVVEDTTPPYPRNLDIYFFKCRKKDKVIPKRETRPTPSYDTGPVLNETTGTYQVVDNTKTSKGFFLIILLVNIAFIVIGSALLAYFFFGFLKKMDSGTTYTVGRMSSSAAPEETSGVPQTSSQPPNKSQSKVTTDSSDPKLVSVKPIPENTVEKPPTTSSAPTSQSGEAVNDSTRSSTGL